MDGAMTQRCGDCEHWHHRQAHLGQCYKWYGGNGQDGYVWKNEDIPLNGVVVETDEGWGAYTGREFGCVLFEERVG